jgi:hypothetical protein
LIRKVEIDWAPQRQGAGAKIMVKQADEIMIRFNAIGS